MKITENQSLKELTTFKTGGNARYFCTVENEDELIQAIGFSKKNKIPFFILGGGSNILVSDNGFDGIVIKIEIKGIKYEESDNKVKAIVGAGENWDNFVADTVDKGYYGLENLSLIPGTVGASPVQNIGAYGSEVKDTIESVYVLDVKEDEYKIFSNSECHFSYRDSIFKKEKGRYIVISVTFNLQKEGKLNLSYKDVQDYFGKRQNSNPSLRQVRNAIIDIRTNKLPNLQEYGTAGSFFKNVIVSQSKARELLSKYPELIVHQINDKKVKIPLAWILDNVCGFKGKRKGNVGVYKNQALVLVNYGNASSNEVIDLAQEMVDSVYEKTGIEIFPEVEYVI
jgi:UDP-N-acetylmuramate dehydrogenase